jgi:hypothetical protein
MRDDKTKPADDLKFYLNTYFRLFAEMDGNHSYESLKSSLAKYPIETVDEYFEKQKRWHMGKGDSWAHNFKADMNRFPDRVKRLNKLAVQANRCTTVKKLEKISNEVGKLVNGDMGGK